MSDTKRTANRRTASPVKRSSGIDYRRLSEFRYELRKFMEFSSSAARQAGLTPQQHQALLAIKGLSATGTVRVGDIAARLISRHNSTVELLNRLADLGMVRRQTDAEDRRRINIVLTPKAEHLLEKLSDAHIAELKRLRPLLRSMVKLLG